MLEDGRRTTGGRTGLTGGTRKTGDATRLVVDVPGVEPGDRRAVIDSCKRELSLPLYYPPPDEQKAEGRRI
jgi:hypothetical protein